MPVADEDLLTGIDMTLLHRHACCLLHICMGLWKRVYTCKSGNAALG